MLSREKIILISENEVGALPEVTFINTISQPLFLELAFENDRCNKFVKIDRSVNGRPVTKYVPILAICKDFTFVAQAIVRSGRPLPRGTECGGVGGIAVANIDQIITATAAQRKCDITASPSPP